ncbi:MAG: hypothetical protein J7K46_05305 [Bacteroidales bacterium]|nr:hypothetical protein [Bacteroidales bacterium]
MGYNESPRYRQMGYHHGVIINIFNASGVFLTSPLSALGIYPSTGGLVRPLEDLSVHWRT